MLLGLSETNYKKLWPGRGLATTNVRLQNLYIPDVGSTTTQVSYANQRAQLPLIVVKGDGPTLLGRNLSDYIEMNFITV